MTKDNRRVNPERSTPNAEGILKLGSRNLIVVAAMLVTSFAMVIVPSDTASATSNASAEASTPIRVEEALSVVASSLGNGPLTIDTSEGSVAGGVWSSDTENGSSGVSQHWSLRAFDSTGTIVLGIMVTDNGTEAVSGWVPGTSTVNNWIFSASGS
ncbi:MAG TPA: hypothetical protein VFN59_09185, partial [Acidimicrobiales bacterium]|nr:hypothetical protein [Acidimicrobiales bacterium]